VSLFLKSGVLNFTVFELFSVGAIFFLDKLSLIFRDIEAMAQDFTEIYFLMNESYLNIWVSLILK